MGVTCKMVGGSMHGEKLVHPAEVPPPCIRVPKLAGPFDIRPPEDLLDFQSPSFSCEVYQLVETDVDGEAVYYCLSDCESSSGATGPLNTQIVG